MGARTGIEIDKRGSRLKVNDAHNGRISVPVNQGSTATSNYAAGLMHFGSSGSTDVYSMDAPLGPGVELELSCVAATSNNVSIVSLSTGDVVLGATGAHNIKFKAPDEALTLVSRSSTRWDFASQASTEMDFTTT